MVVVKPHLDCVAQGRLGLEDVLLAGDVVVVVLVVEGAVAKDGLVRLSLDAGPGASCTGLKFGAATAKMAALQQTLAAGSLFILCILCLLYTSPSPRDATLSRMPSSA